VTRPAAGWPRDKDTDEFDRTAFCGPVRHLEKPDAGVWDSYSFDATVSDKSVTVDNIGLKEMGTSFPASRRAYRADRADLPYADQLAAPKAGKIIAPNLQVTDVGHVDTIAGEAVGIMARPTVKSCARSS
jgi:hypothetical protein